MENELNPPPIIEETKELTFRENAINRLLTDHNDLGQVRVAKWLALLYDEDPSGRAMATTAVWTMMDVRDSRKSSQANSATFDRMPDK